MVRRALHHGDLLSGLCHSDQQNRTSLPIRVTAGRRGHPGCSMTTRALHGGGILAERIRMKPAAATAGIRPEASAPGYREPLPGLVNKEAFTVPDRKCGDRQAPGWVTAQPLGRGPSWSQPASRGCQT